MAYNHNRPLVWQNLGPVRRGAFANLDRSDFLTCPYVASPLAGGDHAASLLSSARFFFSNAIGLM